MKLFIIYEKRESSFFFISTVCRKIVGSFKIKSGGRTSFKVSKDNYYVTEEVFHNITTNIQFKSSRCFIAFSL